MELSSEFRSLVQIALGQLIVARPASGQSDYESLGHFVAAAFIATERHESAHVEYEDCEAIDDTACVAYIKIGDTLPIK